MAIEASSEQTREPRIRLGMVGGGAGAFIGAVHRIAARIDDQYDLIAGALSASSEKAIASGRDLGLDPSRTYSSYREMAIREAKLKNGIEAVAIVTPNHVHYDAAKEFLKRGIHVICDKPLTSNLADAKKLKKIADESGALFVLTHNYTGYPMVRQAREMIANGELGDIRVVQAEYPQDWLTEAVEQTGQKQAAWRTDPAQSGVGGSTGDIGTHAYNLAAFITGLELDSLAADLDSFVPGRRLDDNAHVMLRFKAKGSEKPAKGMLWCSQVAPGQENGLMVRVYGTKGGLEWTQKDPNYLWYTPFGESKRLITRGGAGSGAAAGRVTRVPSGHPEGYLEAFATIYTEAAHAINARKKDKAVDKAVVYPTVDDGVKGVAFVEACVASSKKNGAWVKV
ncbi:Gfo/Idh/MocA family protein [Rhizobium laguerreae]|uniref:Gfo/Idh/MocA family protein n=1 Tax=Rhizobium laguerreae TaxID=1076926 RepID=UPI001C90BFE4|nr:Gfo/Idh/MocA family oxidoreductase [Rhizobium laguerreae]MBY3346174.1 Gfo/Idh/MocA family oxidoreductase [Rhizobium laguerreae]MBY3353135.1 Gfo/Idh/MocA family oxidoreductase [Rhizobium laguerreae]MBY3373881.1 Gfo/Idh/MocA family oxidoreductase [Rhizobium laguerreae]MBY3429411.1 Gfo/Idh/MocA family oxidoreductase [Rhizobium laguerreae]MBY3438058.1 Gfo/Idh/MocA family oxidoreductase [Rhizobium laguerreae]